MSFEVFVRPFIAPAIRPPAKPPILPFQDTPEQGVAVLRGLGGKLIDLTFSETSSWSKSVQVETKRQVDVERVYQKKPNGEIEKENYVDVERMKKLEMQDGNGQLLKYDFALPSRSDNIELLEENKWIINANAPEPEGDTEEGGTPP